MKKATKEKRKKTYLSAKTILVRVTFSIVNFVFPSFPAIRPIALERCSPCKGLTRLINNILNNLSIN